MQQCADVNGAHMKIGPDVTRHRRLICHTGVLNRRADKNHFGQKVH